MTLKASDIRWADSSDPKSWGFTASKQGVRNSNLHNVAVALEHDPALSGLVWFDAFQNRLLTDGGVEWTDEDDVRVAMHLQRVYRLDKVGAGMVRDVVAQRAKQAPRHCVREWLESLNWDGVERLPMAFEDLWGAPTGPAQPDDYLRAVSQNFFLTLVARVMDPGCKVDTMVVFEGEQGTRKSSALEALGGPWHTVSHESVTSKDFFQVLPGAWIVELAELDTISRAEVTRVKSVLSTRVD
ncbi:MAG TPA: VapE domain-containing protein, partial [Vicinamibacterales bacterium]|nr:VapE domain-containing protein [Vicinamibacterales bacterium]